YPRCPTLCDQHLLPEPRRSARHMAGTSPENHHGPPTEMVPMRTPDRGALRDMRELWRGNAWCGRMTVCSELLDNLSLDRFYDPRRQDGKDDCPKQMDQTTA